MPPPTNDEQQQAATSAFLAAMQHSHQQLQQQQQQQLQIPAGPEESSSSQQQPFQLPHPYSPTQQFHNKQPLKREQEGNDDQEEEDEADVGNSSNSQTKAPPRKAQRRSSASNAKGGGAASSPSSGNHSAGDNPPGPPYVCPSCKTTYSRLEYLRRHERRHQDIRPFVCECGKGFSRSDVLSRHKRQCHWHLTGEQPSADIVEAAAKKTRKLSTANRSRKAGTSSAGGANGSSQGRVDSQSPSPTQSYPQPSHSHYSGSVQSGQPPLLLPQTGGTGSMGLPPPPPFYSQQASNAAAAAAAAAAVAAGHGGSGGSASSGAISDGAPGNVSSTGTDYSRANGFMTAIHHALHTFGHNQTHSNYPPSPESNQSSRNSSPRLHYRDTIPYTHRSSSTSGGSRPSSLRKGALDPYHAPVPWGGDSQEGRSSPAPGSSASRPSSIYGKDGSSAAVTRTSSGAGLPLSSAGAGVGSGVGLPGFTSGSSASVAPLFSYPANEFAAPGTTASSGSQNQTLAPAGNDNQPGHSQGSQQGQQSGSQSHSRSDPPRFSVSTGPLSPFSGMGLPSSMSPYLSAFSNARDTPLVASPGRGGAPGTPTSSLNANVFDFTMRPPPGKPANSASLGRNGSGSAPEGKPNPGGPSSNASLAPKSKMPISTASPQASNDPSTPSASMSMAGADGGALPALADFIDDQQRSAANGLLTLLGGGGAETPSRFVRSDAGRPSGAATNNDGNAEGAGNTSGMPAASQSTVASRNGSKSDTSIDTNPGTSSAKPSSNPFFEQAVTPGPEAFLLRLHGGEQSTRAGLSSSSNLGGASNGDQFGQSGHGLGKDGMLQTHPVPHGGPDTPNYGMEGGGWGDFSTSSNLNSNVGWLLSPSIQALISSFATGATPVTGGDGFGVSASGGGGGYFALTRQHGPSALGITPSLKPILASETGDMYAGAGEESNAAPSIDQSNGAVGPIGASATEANQLSVAQLGNIALEKALEDINNPFYLPRSMFKTCYSIPHWNLPSRARLSMLAMHSQQNLCKHIPIQHEPTFRLDSTPGCLAFAICMLGCHEVGRRWFGGLEVVPLEKAGSIVRETTLSDGKKETPLRDEEDNQELVKPIVMTEKMDMLMRSFPNRCTNIKDKVSVVQALLFFQTSNFLSSDATVRAIASISHGPIVSLARKAGFFDPEAEHVSASLDWTPEEAMQRLLVDNNELAFAFSFLPSYLPSCTDEEKVWRLWCEYEGRRRTAFLLFLMDTVAALDAGTATMINVSELRHLPLPAPDSIWRASDPKSFKRALDGYQRENFDNAMLELLRDEEDTGQEEEGHDSSVVTEPSSPSSSSLLAGRHGPFARLVIILAILRGIVHLLQDEANVPSPLAAWLSDSPADAKADGIDEKSDQVQQERTDASVEIFKRALGRWRRAWDEDPLCLQASSPVAQAKAEAAKKAEELASLSVGGVAGVKAKIENGAGIRPMPKDSEGVTSKVPLSIPPTIFTSKTASGATPLCEDALPFYWLSHVLLGHATSKQVATTSSSLGLNGNRDSTTLPSEQGAEEDLEKNGAYTSSTTTSAGDTLPSSQSMTTSLSQSSGGRRRVPDFRSMLRFAKTFVSSGEGVNGTTSGGELSFASAAVNSDHQYEKVEEGKATEEN